MPRAVVLTTASKSSTTGGTFADALTANTGDSLSVANYGNGQAKILEMWGIDDTSVAELSMVYTRPESTHDQSRGFRVEIPALVPGGAGTVQAHQLLGGRVTADLYKSDVATLNVTSTAADAVVVSYQILYDDLPGAAGVFCSWAQVSSLQKSLVGINSQAQASGTKGAYGASRAFNADDDRLHANTWYALLGGTVRTQVTTISLTGPDWGGQRIGFPAGSPQVDSSSWFVDQEWKWGLPIIPCFNSNNRGSINIQVANATASTTPQIDFVLYELNGTPTAGA